MLSFFFFLLEKKVRTYVLSFFLLICIIVVTSHKQTQYDFYLHQNSASHIISSSSNHIFGRNNKELSEDFQKFPPASQPSCADWRTIFRDIQKKRKLEKERQDKTKESENVDRNNRDSVLTPRRHHERTSAQKTDRFPQKSAPNHAFYHELLDSNRFESDETWRTPEMFSESNNVRRDQSVYAKNPITKQDQQYQQHETSQLPLSQNDDKNQGGGITKADFIKQQLSHDFGYNTHKVFLLLKTGYSVQWDRLPMHLLTTLTKFPNFGIYSDTASSVVGYEVMDILADLPKDVLKNQQLGLYHEQQKQRRSHAPPHFKSFMFEENRPALQKPQNLNGNAWIIDKFKVLPMLRHAWLKSPDLDWYVLIDDDTYVLADNMGKWLNTLDPDQPYYLGSAVAGLSQIFAHGGSGIILSRGLMKQAFGSPKTDEWLDEYAHRALKECCGDFLLALFLKEKLNIDLNIDVSGKRFQGEPLAKVACNQHNWCTPITTFHHSTPRDMELLWEYERSRAYYSTDLRKKYEFAEFSGLPMLENPPITYSDIYTDFIKPYLRPVRLDWDNNANEIQFLWLSEFKAGHATIDDYDRDESSANKPYMSVDQCRQACFAQENCLMFRYDPYQKYCGISMSVALGSTSPGSHERSGDRDVTVTLEKYGVKVGARTEAQGMYSEWRLNNIEAMRTKQNCDPKAENTISNVDDRKEGWYWQARTKYESEATV